MHGPTVQNYKNFQAWIYDCAKYARPTVQLLQLFNNSAQQAVQNPQAMLSYSLYSHGLLKPLPFQVHHSLLVYRSLNANPCKLRLKYLWKVKLIKIRWLWAKTSKYDLISQWIKEISREERWDQGIKVAKFRSLSTLLCLSLACAQARLILKRSIGKTNL